MVAPKTLFNASAKQCAVELVERCWAVTLDLTQVDITLAPSYSVVNVTIAQKESVTQGRRYEGSTSFIYEKLSVLTHIPQNMIYTDVYPVTFESFASNFLANYGFLIEENDFAIVEGNVFRPLQNGVLMKAAPNENDQIFLTALSSSGRWIAGETFPIYVLYRNIYDFALTIKGDAPDAVNTSDYTYQYEIRGGTPPYHATIIEGSLPFALSPTNGILYGQSPENGSFSWKVGVTDAAGNYDELSDSLEVVPGSLSFSNASTLSVPAGEAIDFMFTSVGGRSPKTYAFIDPVPGLSLTSQGRLTGYLVPSTTILNVRCTDANNSSIEGTVSLTVQGRDIDIVRQSLRNKLLGGHWYQFFAGRTDLGNYKIPDLISGNDLIWQTVGVIESVVDEDDILASLKTEDAHFISTNTFVALPSDFTVYLRLRGPVDQPNCFLLGTTDGVNGWQLRIDDTGTGIEFKGRGNAGDINVFSDEGVSETLHSSIVVSKLGRNLWILANSTLKHITLPYDTKIVEGAIARLALGKYYSGGGLPYYGAFELAAVLRYGLLPDEIDLLTNDQQGQQLADLKTELGMIPLQPFGFQEHTLNLFPDNNVLTGSLVLSSGESSFSTPRFLDHVLEPDSTLQISTTDVRKLNYTFKVRDWATTTTYLAVTDAKGRVSRIKINLIAS